MGGRMIGPLAVCCPSVCRKCYQQAPREAMARAVSCRAAISLDTVLTLTGPIFYQSAN
jgi:hypothetical protein